jgi:hypothetical protein
VPSFFELNGPTPRTASSDPLVSRGPDFLETRLNAPHADQYHFEPAPSTDTRATTGATLADHRTTVAIVDDFFMVFPPIDKHGQQGLGAESNERATQGHYALGLSTTVRASLHRRMGD